MTPLRRRMFEELSIRNYSPRTIDTYIQTVAAFARHYGRSPDQLGVAAVREYQVHLVGERDAKSGTLCVVAAALRFFYRVVMKRSIRMPPIVFPRREKRLPVVLSRDEVGRLLTSAASLRDRALLLTAYATGLRVSELVGLRVSDIDGARRMIRVCQGKGAKDRYIPLFPVLHEALRDYYRKAHPKEWLFPGNFPTEHLSRDAALHVCYRARARAGLTKPVTPHTLRRCFATHLLESGVDLFTIKNKLGHQSLKTVQRYTLVSNRSVDPDRTGMDLLQGLGVPPQLPDPPAP